MTDFPDIPLPLTTPRLVLRDFRGDDFAAVHAYASDPEVTRYVPWGPNTEEITREVLQQAAAAQTARPRIDFNLAITLTGDSTPVGSVGLHLREETRLTAEIGYVLRPDQWGKGVATEAASAVINAGFSHLGLRRIWATCDARNTGSWNVMEKLGLTREARLRRDRCIKGEWRDTLVYAILADEWEQQRAQACSR